MFEKKNSQLKADEMICNTCSQQFNDFEFFISDLKIKHETLWKQVILKRRIENHQIMRKAQFDPLKTTDQSDLYNSHDGFDQNGDGMSDVDDDVVELPTTRPEVHEIFDDEESNNSSEHFDPSENLEVTVDPDGIYDNKDDFYHEHEIGRAHV